MEKINVYGGGLHLPNTHKDFHLCFVMLQHYIVLYVGRIFCAFVVVC